MVFLSQKEFGYISYVISNETRSVHWNAMWISMPKDRSTDYCWRYCLLHRLSRSETLRLRNQSELSLLTWRERSFLKVSRCRDWSRPVIGRAIAGRRATLALWDLAVPELGVATFLMPQTSQPKTKETNEANNNKKWTADLWSKNVNQKVVKDGSSFKLMIYGTIMDNLKLWAGFERKSKRPLQCIMGTESREMAQTFGTPNLHLALKIFVKSQVKFGRGHLVSVGFTVNS